MTPHDPKSIFPTVTGHVSLPTAPKRGQRSVRLGCDVLESRDTTGNILTGFVLAALGGPLADPLIELARLVGDWAMLAADRQVGPRVGEQPSIKEAEPRQLTELDTWLDPQLGNLDAWRILPSWSGVVTGRAGSLIEFGEPAPRLTVASLVSDYGLRSAARPSWNVSIAISDGSSHGAFAPDSTSPLDPAVYLPTAKAASGPNSDVTPITAAYGTRITNYIEPPEIPNQAPSAVNDSATVDEDDSVVFDPSANDTDPDGDPLWVKGVQDVTSGGRTFWEDGGLIRYIPNPDFSGPDKFTYTVTDGLAEATGTVTVTVNPVNDPVNAMNDAFNFVYSAPYGTPFGGKMTPNDTDYDNDPLITVEADISTAVGKVHVYTDGTFLLYTNPSANGTASFDYTLTDGHGSSDTATVKMAVRPYSSSPPPPAPYSNPDLYAIGDDILGVSAADGVLSNDEGGTFAVLGSHPKPYGSPSIGGGRLNAFAFDGSFEYQPDFVRGDQSFTYILWRNDMTAATTQTVTLSEVNLTLHHGQNGKAVSELNQRLGAVGGSLLIPAFKATGGFTVANLNDSNANGIIDSLDNDVPAVGKYPGSGENDLMKLVMKKPTPGNGTVKLTVSPADGVKLWKLPTKGNQEIPLTNGMVEFAVDAIPSEVWVELTKVSGVVGDVSMKMEYGGASDTANATAIWTQYAVAAPHWPAGHFMNVGVALPPDADDRGVKAIFQMYDSLGLVDRVQKNLANGAVAYRQGATELSQFTVQPAGLTPFSMLGIVRFDVARAFEGYMFYDNDTNRAQMTTTETIQQPPRLEVPNDEGPNAVDADNDNDLLFTTLGKAASTDHLYSIDSPASFRYGELVSGVPLDAPNFPRFYELVYRHNFFDFVRVRFGTSFVAGQDEQGSRSSVFYYWSVMRHLKEKAPAVAGGVWTIQRITAPGTVTENRVEMGHINTAVAGGGVI